MQRTGAYPSSPAIGTSLNQICLNAQHRSAGCTPIRNIVSVIAASFHRHSHNYARWGWPWNSIMESINAQFGIPVYTIGTLWELLCDVHKQIDTKYAV